MWEDFSFEARILAILQDYSGYPGHHMAPSFLTPYQIAIEFANRHGADFRLLEQRGFGIGGEGAGVQNSLPQYIAQQLSSRLKDGRITNIEGAFLSSRHLKDHVFVFEGLDVRSSLPAAGLDVSIFRARSDG